MYNPKGNGRVKLTPSVEFDAFEPPPHLAKLVSRFLHIRTNGVLEEDYKFHALPDACTYMVFDQLDPQITAATRLLATSAEFNLGRSFHFLNIQFLPGVWRESAEPIRYGVIDTPYVGTLPLVETNESLRGIGIEDKLTVLVRFVEALRDQVTIGTDPLMEKIFVHMDEINSVADMSDILQMSPRHIQRIIKSTTGFSPHDFVKVLRLQRALIENDTSSYADQSHFIHAFRKATGYTPKRYAQKFDV
jgi:AraC-like DNA-binding protein